MSVSGTSAISSTWSQTIGAPGAQPVKTSSQSTFTAKSGTGADQASLKYAKPLTLAATPTVLDLTALVDLEGNAFAFAAIRWIKIVNLSTTAALTIGYASTTANAWTSWLSNPGTLAVPPSTATNPSVVGAIAPAAAAFAVNSTNKLLKLDPGANTFSVVVEIVGS